jgi:hypothetical protein
MNAHSGSRSFVAPDGIRQGLAVGLVGATMLAAYVGVISLLRGSARWPQYGNISTWAIIAAYYVAGTIGGAVVGALRPLSRWRLGQFARGWIGGTIVYASLGLPMGFGAGITFALASVLGLATGGLALVIKDDEPRDSFRWWFVGPLVGIAAVLALIMKLAAWW